jgi:hypothetical protein
MARNTTKVNQAKATTAKEPEAELPASKGRELKSLDKGGGKEVSNGDENGGLNYFEQYGNSASQKSITGRLLKFSKGDYLAGEDEEEIDADTTLVAIMDQLNVGWIKWEDNKPVQQIMGPVAEGYQPPRRNTLGDDDKDLWEVDSNGKPRDPWQFSNYLIMKDPGKNGDPENLYTFATSSTGGRNAIGEVCKVFGKEMRRKPDEWPIIKLGVSSYNHSNKEYGRIKIPVLEVVGWEPKSVMEEVEPPKKAAARGKR